MYVSVDVSWQLGSQRRHDGNDAVMDGNIAMMMRWHAGKSESHVLHICTYCILILKI